MIGRVEVGQSLLYAGTHSLLSLTNPHSGARDHALGPGFHDWAVEYSLKVLLVGLVIAVRVSDLLHDVVLLVEHVVSNARQVGVSVTMLELYHGRQISG